MSAGHALPHNFKGFMQRVDRVQNSAEIGRRFGCFQRLHSYTLPIGPVWSRIEQVLSIDTFWACWQGFPMPRKLRLEYPGARDHELKRGDQREDI